MAVLAASIPNAVGSGSATFALAYAVVRLVLVLEYLRAGIHVKAARPLIRQYSTGFTVALALSVASTLVDEPERYVIWVVNGDRSRNRTVGRRYQDLLPSHPQQLPERFGLFVVIVLGESIASIVRGLSDADITPVTLASAAAGVVLAFGIWWLYFEDLEESVVLRTRVAGQV